MSDVLRERNVSVLCNSECQARWDASLVSPNIHSSHICVDEVDGTSACQVRGGR